MHPGRPLKQTLSLLCNLLLLPALFPSFAALRCGFLFLTLAEKGKISKYHSGVEISGSQRAEFMGLCCFIVYHYSQDDLPAGEAGFF